MNFSSSIFNVKPQIQIPKDTKIIFVADLFAEDYVGGAELTSQALIDASPFQLFKLHSRDVTQNLIQVNLDKFWVFGNFAQLNPQLIQIVIQTLNYSILEYDYKFCQWRSPELHESNSKSPCDCHTKPNGQLIYNFFAFSRHIWWMSEKQRNHYFSVFPNLHRKANTVLSSVFDKKTFERIDKLNQIMQLGNAIFPKEIKRSGWIVLGSNSWVKGFEAAKKWCEDNKKQYEVVWNVPYDQLLEKLSTAEGFVYFPAGKDTCPRMVIEAKLLGCQLVLNENVQHANEEWFSDVKTIRAYLEKSTERFWDGIKKSISYHPTISGYTTVYNAIRQEYPFMQCIKSMLAFCDEVCVVDGGSTDGTLETLLKSFSGNEKVKIKQVKRDWSAPNYPIFDGMQKAEARSMCTSEFCWQMDSDEIVHEDDADKIRDICKYFSIDYDILSLPVIEYWCGPDKVRCDIQPWKWRLSRNAPYITHGIPGDLRVMHDGLLYAKQGTDGCDMIHKVYLEPIRHANFYNQDVEQVRQQAMQGNSIALVDYMNWFNKAVKTFPCVFHYSWYDMNRKMNLYKNYWQNHWMRLYNLDDSDTAENNKFFGIPWSSVTDEMIQKKCSELARIGGWIWHNPWKGQFTPSIFCDRKQPYSMLK
jgi:glycosyltransferase involved in cell wall biosynthesis